MQWFVFTPSIRCATVLILVHVAGFYMASTLPWQWALVSIVGVLLHLLYNLYRWVWLCSKYSVLSVRVQANVWQIKTREGWHEVTVEKALHLGVVFLYFKAKHTDYVSMLCEDSCPNFRQLMAATTLALHSGGVK